MNKLDGLTVRQAIWPDDAGALEELRNRVFVVEQGVPRDIEWDGQDADAQHIIATLEGAVEGAVVGCGRLLSDGRIGRLAVVAQHRGKNIGGEILNAILGIARLRGQTALYLHAQTDAIGFYQRAGFSTTSPPFTEAGIEHVNMSLRLDYRAWDEPIAQLRYPQPFSELVIAQAALARRELRILSPKLDNRVFDNEDLVSAMRRLIRSGSLSRIEILVQDARAIVQRGHRLLALSRRLPSRMEIRRLEDHPQWNDDTLVIRDRAGVLELPGSDADFGFYRPQDRPQAEAGINRFDELWRLGQVDAEFRALSL